MAPYKAAYRVELMGEIKATITLLVFDTLVRVRDRNDKEVFVNCRFEGDYNFRDNII